LAHNKRIVTQLHTPLFGQPNTLVGRARYRRASFADLTGYPALAYFRSVDRFMPDGTTDATNGGYWVIDETVIDIRMLGAVLDGTDNGHTTAMQALAAMPFGDLDIRLPAGDIYLGAEAFVQGKNLSFVGAGSGLTRIRCTNITGKVKFLDTATTTGALVHKRLQVKGVSFFKDYISSAHDGACGIEARWSFTGIIASWDHSTFDGVVFQGQDATRYWDVGVRLIDGGCIRMYNMRFDNPNSQSYNSTAGIEIVRDKASNICDFLYTNFFCQRFNALIQFTHTAATQNWTIEGIYLTNYECVSRH
jgi:hypothetical protein